MGSIRSVVATAVIAALVTSSCGGGDDEPESEPTPIMPSTSSSEPSPSPAPSETAQQPPEMPDKASDRSFDGVEEFMDYWAETFTYAMNTGDTATYDAISGPGCRSCRDSSAAIVELYDGGGRIESDGWEVVQLGFSNNTKVAEPRPRIRRGRERVFNPGESKPEIFQANDTTFEFSLRRDADEWIVSEFRIIE